MLSEARTSRRAVMTPRSYRPQGPFSGPPFLGTAVGRIIIATVAMFFVQNLLPLASQLLALTPRLVIERLFVWQLATYMFLHGGFWHLFFNLVVLYFLGNMVEGAWGSRRFLRYYVVCGIGGGLLHMLFDYNASVVGASGAIFGLYLAAAMLFPDAYVYLYFLIPVRMKYLVIGLAVLQLANGIAGVSGTAYFAHLGGMVAGLWFFRGEIARRLGVARGRRRAPSWRPRFGLPKRHGGGDAVGNIDSILDKISAKGYDNLTPTEKRILENYSRQQRESGE
jgi:membrane associated rhomboid family serine protease